MTDSFSPSSSFFYFPFCYQRHGLRALLLSLTVIFSPISLAEPLVWKATKGNQTLMLIGTIHIGHQNMYPLPDKFGRFFNHSDALIIEAEITDNRPQLDLSQAHRSQEVLSNQQTQQLMTIIQQLNLNGNEVLQLPPWLVAISLEMNQYHRLGLQVEYGVDSVLEKRAKRLKKPVYSFESAQQQFDMLMNLPGSGEDLLADTLQFWPQAPQLYSCMLQSWQKGDKNQQLQLAAMTHWSEQTLQQILYLRNQAWIEKIADPQFLAPQGNYVVAVGSLHLLGKHNLIDLLQQQGYHTEQISRSESAQCELNLT